MDYPIFIPTYKRNRIITYEHLPQELQERVVMVVHPSSTLEETYPKARFWKTRLQGKGIALVRQGMLEECREKHIPVCIMIDDDLKFKEAVFNDPDRPDHKRFVKASEESIIKAFTDLSNKALGEVTLKDGFKIKTAFTTFSTPFFNLTKNTWGFNKRMAHSFFINVETTRECNFKGLAMMSDVKFSLECYTRGLCSWSSMYLAAVDSSKPGQGGCASLNRTREFEGAIGYLTQRWPNYVKERDASRNQRHQKNLGTTRDISFWPMKAWKAWVYLQGHHPHLS